MLCKQACRDREAERRARISGLSPNSVWGDAHARAAAVVVVVVVVVVCEPLRMRIGILTPVVTQLPGATAGWERTATIEDVGWELFRCMLDVASGRKKTWAEHWKLHNQLVLFNPAPVT